MGDDGKRRCHNLWALAFVSLLLVGCGVPTAPPGTSNATPEGTATIPLMTVTPTSGCTLAINGQIQGAITQQGHTPVGPVYVSAIFTGGPAERVLARDGQYILPLLERQCPDGLHWLQFRLSAVGVSQILSPAMPDLRSNLDVGQVPNSVPPDLPDCILVAGSLSGRVLVHSLLAPNGTAVTSEGEPGMASLEQTTTTRGGRYTLPSIGVQCGLDSIHPLIASVAALGVVVPVAPTRVDMEQDIFVS